MIYEPSRELKARIFTHIDNSREAIAASLQQLVRFPTVNPPGNERAHQEYLADKLEQLGLEVSLHAQDPERPNIVAVLPGTGGGNNLLHYAGHADVVAAGNEDEWDYPPFGGVIDDGWIFGRGAVDHKAPIAASLGSLRAILDSGIQLKGDLIFMVPVDEELGSWAGTKYLLQREGALRGDMGIYASAGFLEQVLISCSGTLTFEITVRGRASHSGYPKAGVNAIEKASKLVLALQNMEFEKINPFWNPEDNDRLKPTRTGSLTVAKISGGGALNIVPGTCVISGSRRLIPTETIDEAKKQIENIIQELSANDHDFEAHAVYPVGVHGINTPQDSPVVRVVESAVRDIGLDPEIGGSSGGFDARWIVDALGIPFVSYGAGWNGPDGKLCLHAPNEGITIDNLIGMTKGFAMIIIRACGVKNE